MKELHDLDNITVQLDEYYIKKPNSGCRDEFLNTQCEENGEDILFGNDEDDS